MNHCEIAEIVNKVLKGSENNLEMDILLMKFENNLREKEMEDIQLEAVDDMDEQFLTMQCFEEIDYYYIRSHSPSIIDKYYDKMLKSKIIKQIKEI
jgi:hypothetical protein